MRLAVTVAALLLPVSIAAAAAPEWVARSNVYAVQVLDDAGRFNPEFATRAGRDKFDTEVADLGPRYIERGIEQAEKRAAELRAALAQEKDPRVRQDVQILIDNIDRNVASQRLRHARLLEPIDAAGTVNFGLTQLLDARNSPERQARALIRMRRYAGLEPGYTPIAQLARERDEEELARPGLIGPYAADVQQKLANTDLYLKGLEQLFRRAKLTGWEKDLDVLGRQLREYREWVKGTVLPRVRPDVKLPPELYADQLRQAGVDMSPAELIDRASADFQETRTQLQVLAARIAAERGLP
ncbi:MAG TPA: DUF885 family protein, partial [Usitatibacter sp.]|nr:DUF885 family protein [Usitatibacter sp.]